MCCVIKPLSHHSQAPCTDVDKASSVVLLSSSFLAYWWAPRGHRDLSITHLMYTLGYYECFQCFPSWSLRYGVDARPRPVIADTGCIGPWPFRAVFLWHWLHEVTFNERFCFVRCFCISASTFLSVLRQHVTRWPHNLGDEGRSSWGCAICA